MLKDKTAEAMAKTLGYTLTDDKADDTKVDDTKVDDTKVDDTKVDDTKVDDTKTDDTKVDDAKVDDTKVDDTKVDDKTSSGDQKDDTKVPDQDDKVIIPDSGNSDDGAGQATDFEKTLAERSNGRFKSLADIDKALEDAPAQAFANEQIAKINEYVKGGGKLDEYVRTQTVDYTAMTPEQLVFEQMSVADPDMTAEEVQLLMEDEFGVAEDATDRAKTIAGAKLKKAARAAKEQLLEHQQKWATPAPDDKASKAAQQKAWEGNLSKATETVEDIQIALNQTENFTFKLEPDVKKQISEGYKDLSKFWDRYLNEDGSENVGKFVQDMAKLDHFEAIVRSAASATKTDGKKEVIKDIKNTDFTGKDNQKKEEAPKSIVAQAAAQFYKHNR